MIYTRAYIFFILQILYAYKFQQNLTERDGEELLQFGNHESHSIKILLQNFITN